MELKSELALYVTLFLSALGIWFVFSSSSYFYVHSAKVKACITVLCLLPAILFFYFKFSPAPPAARPTKDSNPHWIPSTQALDLCQSKTWAKHAVAQSSPTSCCMIFEYIMKLHGKNEWGTVLDAGTGAHSLSWVIGLNTTRWTAITGSQQRADNMINTFKAKMRPEDRVVYGNWVDPELLKDEVYDVVLADYLLGSIDGFAPYFQDKLFERLRPHTKKHLYFVGMEPLPDSASTPQGRLVIEIAKTRDACILLAGHRCYREYPQSWTLRQLTRCGFKIENVSNFETIQTPDFVETQLNVAESKLEFIHDLQVAEAMASNIKRLRNKMRSMKWDIRFGSDYVIYATKVET